MGLSRSPAQRSRQTAANAEPERVPGLAARRAAQALLIDVLDKKQALDARLDAPNTPFAELHPTDRALARAIVSTALRRLGQIDDALDQLIERPLPSKSGSLRRILQVAAVQILFMEVADHAAVSTAMAIVDADRHARHFKPLANGVLRNLARRREDILAGQDAGRLNTPDWLWRSWTAAYGEAGAAAIAEAHLAEPALDLSVKRDPADWAGQLGGAVLPTSSVRLGAHARVETLPGFAEGTWWVQDAAAALPAQLLGDVAGRSVLDLCAAPGGKTAQLAAAGAKVTAVDIAPSRIRRMQRNLDRLGLKAECVTTDVLAFGPGPVFDAILLDPPCTATGTIRRHPDIARLKQEEDVTTLAALQKRMLEHAVTLLRPGGTLVFATCSLQPEEGSAIADAVPSGLPLEPMPITSAEFPAFRPEWIADGWLRTLPSHSAADGLVGLDGFFAARFRRT